LDPYHLDIITNFPDRNRLPKINRVVNNGLRVIVHSSGTGSFFPRPSEDPPNRSNHSLNVLPEKRSLSPSLRCERLRAAVTLQTLPVAKFRNFRDGEIRVATNND
jgi:hypothetical protein